MTDYSDKLVLVADDEPAMVAMVAGYLRGKGFQVIEACDGAQAWDLAHERLPDLVILDVMMPGLSGWEVCRKIKESVSLHHTGVIMLTGIGENLNEMTSPLYGADAYLDKPFDFDDLSAKIEDTLNFHSGLQIPSDTDSEPRKPIKKRPKKADPDQVSLFIDDPEEMAAGAKKSTKKGKAVAKKAAKKAAKQSKPAAKQAPAKAAAKKSKPATKKAAKKTPAKAAVKSKPAAKKAPAKAAKKAAKKAAPKSKPAAKKATKKAPAKAAKKSKPVAKKAPAKAAKKSKPAANKAAKKSPAKAAKKSKPAAKKAPAKAVKKSKPAAKKAVKQAKASKRK